MHFESNNRKKIFWFKFICLKLWYFSFVVKNVCRFRVKKLRDKELFLDVRSHYCKCKGGFRSSQWSILSMVTDFCWGKGNKCIRTEKSHTCRLALIHITVIYPVSLQRQAWGHPIADIVIGRVNNKAAVKTSIKGQEVIVISHDCLLSSLFEVSISPNIYLVFCWGQRW